MAFSGKNGVADLVLLSSMTEEAIKDNLKKRYGNGKRQFSLFPFAFLLIVPFA